MEWCFRELKNLGAIDPAPLTMTLECFGGSCGDDFGEWEEPDLEADLCLLWTLEGGVDADFARWIGKAGFRSCMWRRENNAAGYCLRTLGLTFSAQRMRKVDVEEGTQMSWGKGKKIRVTSMGHQRRPTASELFLFY